VLVSQQKEVLLYSMCSQESYYHRLLTIFMLLWSRWQIHGKKSKESCLTESSYLFLSGGRWGSIVGK